MRIAFAGTGLMGVHLLMPIIESSHEVVAVLQNGRVTKGLSRQLNPAFASVFMRSTNVSGMAKRLGIPILWIDKMTEHELAPLRDLEPDLLLVGGFGIILKPPLLSLPKVGCVNCHTSLLPRHRGPNPFLAVVLAGETESGVTFHVMEEGIDTGPIVDQTPFALTETDTAYTVYQRASMLAGERVVEVLDRIEAEGLKGTSQDESLATYDNKLTEDELLIDWSLPANIVHRKIRACCLSPFARTYYKGDLIHIARASVDTEAVDAEPGTVVSPGPFLKVATGEGTISIRVAFRRRVFPLLWPLPWNRPRAGERLG